MSESKPPTPHGKKHGRRGLLVLVLIAGALAIYLRLRKGSAAGATALDTSSVPVDTTGALSGGGSSGSVATGGDALALANQDALAAVGQGLQQVSDTLATLGPATQSAADNAGLAANAAQAAVDAAGAGNGSATPPPPPAAPPAAAQAPAKGAWWGGRFFTSFDSLWKWESAHGYSHSEATFVGEHPALANIFGLPAVPAAAVKPQAIASVPVPASAAAHPITVLQAATPAPAAAPAPAPPPQLAPGRLPTPGKAYAE